ncbi:interferon lambda receptor 1 isoform X3 [Hippopotamus amphibius kiboko]|uniref:interferon lambda receptor 1 isoform X3 n=1 Tax=Hippopotamus amphibius kiboko TaxID=575201 RepID=UPI00259A8058|nr:interferon lambda receptor 1 isoform X3 [Hippopotamus amphibius kiboko]
MTGARRWAPLLLCLLQSAPGRPLLAPPQNVMLLSRDFSVYLTWLPGPGNAQNVTYFVAYQRQGLHFPCARGEETTQRCHDLPKEASDGTRRQTQVCLTPKPVFFLFYHGLSICSIQISATPRRWRRVKKCAGTKELVCSLMCLEKQDLCNKFKGRVQAVSPSARSPWVESKSMDYFFEVEPAPPVLVFNRTEEILSISATYQLPHCMPQPNLNYEVDFWKEGTRNKTRFPATPHGQPVQIPLQPDTRGHHCLSARTIYTFGYPKYSKFSEPTCFFLEAPGFNWALLVLLPLLLPLLLVIAIGHVIWKSFRENPGFQLTKMPQALDFSGHRHPRATFEPRGPECLHDLMLCPQKELTRRVRLTPRVRVPATVQAGSEKHSAEEEKDGEENIDVDTDDGVSFQPYIEPPPFLGQEHQSPGHAEAGGPWTPLVQVEGSSAFDSSDRSWASTTGSSPWDEAGSSGYLVKKGPGRGPGREEIQKPLPPPEFSEDSSSLEEPPKDDLSSWVSWGLSSPGLNLVPGEPPVSLRTLTFCWDSSPEEEEEEEEEEEDGRRESESEDSGAGSWGAKSLPRTEVRGRTLRHYLAR